MGTALRFEILGPMRARRGTQDVRITGRRQRLLLALLLSESPQVVPTARLIDALWDPESEPADPVNTVQQYVAHLRRSFVDGGGPGGRRLLETSPPGYRMTMDVGMLDADDVSNLAARARDASLSGDLDQSATLAAQALGLWRGTPIAEFADHRYLVEWVRGRESLRTDLVELRGEAQYGLGRYAEVVEALEAEPAVLERPSLAAVMVGSLGFLGRTADALAVADAHRVALAERGIEVGAPMRRLTSDLATQGRPRIDLARVSAVRSATSDALREVLFRVPTGDGLRVGTEQRLELQLAIVDGLSTPEVAGDTSTWLREMRRHEPGVLELLDHDRQLDPNVRLRLALGYARFWDWSGRHDRLRAMLAAAVGPDDPPTGTRTASLVAEAAGWLAFSFRDVAPDRSRHYLDLARAAASGDALGTGRLLAVESVIDRGRSPEHALQQGERAAQLLGHHGGADEAAYAHVVSALAAIDADLVGAAGWHAERADDLYRSVGDRRGLAWVDVLHARLEGIDADEAPRFSIEHDEHTIPEMLEPRQRGERRSGPRS